ncbi:hypothetical protein PP568_25260 [Mycobacteroides abscessus]|uniref:Mercuric transporter MerT n=2 Tax=Mycobacteriaceae TaxID=1762 RepID=A0AB38D855_9MYCO|nr:hypothetical protein [Mycobacteroides abscessus]KKC03503.1 hypothetical protein WU83_18670 [Mycobacterium nebraskense]MBN7557564.1 hypothetical protein [Mycobacteroides abscessus subsp. abscessus]MDM2417965.1 hypothetical protein [Mycobacteroides abscessus]MDO3012299.1 hypothetical protein [Mycobacteroides abscessus subsp. abscessus]CPS55428.1 Mercuric transporter MerT [Mycobacteroides abscessus]
MGTRRSSLGMAGAWALGLVSVGTVLVVCCAGPVLIAGGALGVLGALLHRGWLIGAAVVVVLAAVGYTLRRLGTTRRTTAKTVGPENNSPQDHPAADADTEV